MIIEDRNVITLTYELRENSEQGELLESVESDSPFTFLFGGGNLLPSFEAKLRGLKAGERFSFTLSPEESYGEAHRQHRGYPPRKFPHGRRRGCRFPDGGEFYHADG